MRVGKKKRREEEVGGGGPPPPSSDATTPRKPKPEKAKAKAEATPRCDLCGKRFTRPYSLKRHLSLVHGVDPGTKAAPRTRRPTLKAARGGAPSRQWGPLPSDDDSMDEDPSRKKKPREAVKRKRRPSADDPSGMKAGVITDWSSASALQSGKRPKIRKVVDAPSYKLFAPR